MRFALILAIVIGAVIHQPALASDNAIDFRGIRPGMALAEVRALTSVNPGATLVCQHEDHPELIAFYWSDVAQAPRSEHVSACQYFTKPMFETLLRQSGIDAGSFYMRATLYVVRSAPNTDHRVAAIAVTFPSQNFNSVHDALAGKSGNPSAARTEVFRTRAGADFTSRIVTWTNRQASIELRQFHGSLDQSGAIYTDTTLFTVWMDKVGEAERARIRM